ncbi:HlyC/CorC family transporter [Silicimonas algicola]|uniref:CBS domain protein n=1 Tax=Silicimonas algicola TaxID=1826607 RepID=A0A316G5B4_9RHOB|nr:hemolysin family protein [Silicimonas algicola]AZQ68780.1 HlyC/CorC family transporter [Silicimonas algicola]PWK56141.1 CBS domain protein [Silicimonas algicola]
MGETEGSSNAAQGAPDEDDSSRGILTRWLSALSGSTDRTDEPGEGAMISAGDGFTGGLANLTRLRVEDVMIPKVEVVAVPVDIGKDELVEVFRESGMTRLPVFRETLDQPMGLVHLKDFALRHGFNGSGEKFQLGRMLRPLLYAPPSMPIGVLLQKMQTERLHMALVIDEYGGVDGLVTIEDLIEQVLGEIEDEHDIDEADLWTSEGSNVWLAQARTPIEDFEDAIGHKILIGDDEEEIDTLGGLVFMLAGRVPSRGEVIKHPDGLDFEVVDADPRRIKRLRVRLNMAKAAE